MARRAVRKLSLQNPDTFDFSKVVGSFRELSHLKDEPPAGLRKGEVCFLTGFASRGDTNLTTFYWDPDSGLAGNDLTIIKPNNYDEKGRWIRVQPGRLFTDDTGSLKDENTGFIQDGDFVHVLGHDSRGDGGGGLYFWDSDSTETPDGLTIIKPTYDSFGGTGRWKLFPSGELYLDDISALKSQKTKWVQDGEIATTNGYNSPGDSGAASYWWDSDSQETADSVTIIEPTWTGFGGVGRWKKTPTGRKFFDTLSDLKAQNIDFFEDGETVTLLGGNSAGDGAGATYFWDDGSTESADDITIVAPAYGGFSGTGRWKRIQTGRKFFDTFTELKAQNIDFIQDGEIVSVLGGSSIGDSKRGIFYWDDSSTTSDDGTDIIAPTYGGFGGTGRWKRMIGPVPANIDLDSLNFANKEQGDVTQEDGRVYYDQDVSSTDIDGTLNGSAGGMVLYSTTGSAWGLVIDTNNMAAIDPTFGDTTVNRLITNNDLRCFNGLDIRGTSNSTLISEDANDNVKVTNEVKQQGGKDVPMIIVSTSSASGTEPDQTLWVQV